MNRMRALAERWKEQAKADVATARQHTLVGEEFAMIAHTRRNCAWELLRVLRELDDGPDPSERPTA